MYQFKGKDDRSYIAVTEDKDNKQSPGFLMNPRSLEIRDCSGFGQLTLITKVSSSDKKSYKLDGKGRLWFYVQLLMGDKVDTYHPFPKTYSDLKVYNLLKDCKNDKDAWTVIAKEYKTYYEDITEWEVWNKEIKKGSWVDILQTYCDVVHMQRWRDDRINVKEVLIKYELL